MKSSETKKKCPYVERDISWMYFNQRILLEAARPEVPLLERLTFLGIYSNNLDEFFRVRVATLNRIIEYDDKNIQTEQEIVSLQRNMLETVCQYVKVGGTLLYSTCTMDKMENEDNVTWFLKQHPQFELVKMQQIFPQKTYGDGFFLAKLQKKA